MTKDKSTQNKIITMAKRRLVIHTSDLMQITGKSQRHCQYLITRMREFFNKPQHQYISIKECAMYLGLDPDEVDGVLNG
jgi:hypothetical protein